MTATRIGLVGYGSGGRIFHAPLLASAEGVEFAGVVTRSPDRRAELAEDHPEVPAYDSLADLAAAGVEAVTISTPAATHADAGPRGDRAGPGRGGRQAVRAGRRARPARSPRWPPTPACCSASTRTAAGTPTC